MKLLYGWLTVSVVGTIFFVSGCGSTPSQHPAKTNVTATTNVSASTNRIISTLSKQPIWLEYARYTASQIHINPRYWVLTSKQVNHIEEMLGAIDDPSTASGWHSNVLSVGTKFFAIPGISPVKALAVEVTNGVYLEAVLVGSKKPSS